ncbi:hypothetical protein V7157_12005 [Neobacillus drentensis]|nr:hypothetical protein [Bacillus sp. AFS031507]
MELSQNGFVIITYLLLIWFIVSNLTLVFFCLKDSVIGFFKRNRERME